jgi:hypothetical protein
MSSKSDGILDNVLAQAAAAITLIAGGVYACGALTVSIRLWLRGLPTTTIIGELPRDLLLTTGLVHVLVPAVLGGVVVALLIPNPALEAGAGLRAAIWRLALVAVALTAIVYGAYLWAEQKKLLRGVITRPALELLVPTLVTTTGLLFAALWICRSLPPDWINLRGWAIAFAMVALIPGSAAASAAGPMPEVFVCGSGSLAGTTFDGNLLGSSANNDYIIQYDASPDSKAPPAGARKIVIVPQSEVLFTTLSWDGASHPVCKS